MKLFRKLVILLAFFAPFGAIAQSPVGPGQPLLAKLQCPHDRVCILRLPAGRTTTSIISTGEKEITSVTNATGGQDIVIFPDELTCLENPQVVTAPLVSGELLEIEVGCVQAGISFYEIAPLPPPPAEAETPPPGKKFGIVHFDSTGIPTPAPAITAPPPLCEEPTLSMIDPLASRLVNLVPPRKGTRCAKLDTLEALWVSCQSKNPLAAPVVVIGEEPYLAPYEISNSGWTLRLPPKAHDVRITAGQDFKLEL